MPRLNKKIILEAVEKSMADQRALLKRTKKIATKK